MPPVLPVKLCSQWWRLNHFYTIRDKRGRLVAFEPNAEQRRYYWERHFCNHIGKARQLGMSTFEKILDLDNILFPSGDSILPPSPDGISVGHIDFSLADAKKKLRIIKDAYDNLSNPKLHPETWELGRDIKRAIPIKFTKETLECANGSTMWVGTSLRGSTPQRLDISELGKTAFFFPNKAEEIRSGALNTIAPGNVVNIESTHEGGEAGLHYELMDLAMNNDPAALTLVDFRFHFFAWYECPDYFIDAPGLPIRAEILAYFERVRAATGRTFSHGQMLWYDRTQKKQRHAMKKEFPTTPGEMFEAINQFAIYGSEMADVVAAGRVLDFGLYQEKPIFTFWDIGLSDYTAVWLIQPTDRFFLVLDWFEAEGLPGSRMPDEMLKWERKWKKPIARHFLPHDANIRAPGSGKTYVDELRGGGMDNITVVPRTPDKLIGMGYVRDVLPHCYFNKTYCDTPREYDGLKLPSGVACLKGYHWKISGTKSLREQPEHDHFSHSADAFRTFGEANRLKLIEPYMGVQTGKPKAVGGANRPQTRR